MTHVLLVVPLLIAAAVVYLVPDLSPRYALFGVRARPDVRSSPTGKRAIAAFRAFVVLGFFVAVAAALFAPLSGASAIAPPLILITSGARGFRFTGTHWACRTVGLFELSVVYMHR